MTKTVRIFESGSTISDFLMDITPQNVLQSSSDADIGVVMREYTGNYNGKFEILLLPKEKICEISAKKSFTYGMSSICDITLSSVGEERCVLSIQREIVTIYGQVIEPQELIIPRMHLSPYDAIAIYATLLLTECAERGMVMHI